MGRILCRKTVLHCTYLRRLEVQDWRGFPRCCATGLFTKDLEQWGSSPAHGPETQGFFTRLYSNIGFLIKTKIIANSNQIVARRRKIDAHNIRRIAHRLFWQNVVKTLRVSWWGLTKHKRLSTVRLCVKLIIMKRRTIREEWRTQWDAVHHHGIYTLIRHRDTHQFETTQTH